MGEGPHPVCNGNCEPDESKLTFNAICENPVQAICQVSKGSGMLTDSFCSFDIDDESKAKYTPEGIKATCMSKLEQQRVLGMMEYRCRRNREPDCMQTQRMKSAEQLAQIERSKIYTPDRKKYFTKLFTRVKSKMISMIESSTRIPQKHKAMLTKKVSGVNPLFFDSDLPDCFNPTPEGHSLTIALQEDEGGESSSLVVCAGAMLNIEHTNPYALMHIIGHELAHTFDPCALDNETGKPNFFEEVFPQLIKCIRGGKGADGCTDAKVSCNSEAVKREFCETYRSVIPECEEYIKTIPNCPLYVEIDDSEIDPKHPFEHPRLHPTCQLEEAMPDFFGSEVLANIIEEDQKSGWSESLNRPLREMDKMDTLIAMSAFHTRLKEGACFMKNVPYSHPSGKVRVKDIIMSSPNFRKVVCGARAEEGKPESEERSCRGLL